MAIKVGDVISVSVSGIQPYGAFVIIDKHTTGLIHISEISEGFVRDVHQFVQVNDRINAKVIDVDTANNQIRLSIKALKSSKRRERANMLNMKMDSVKLGFSSLADRLPTWIEQKYKEIEENEHETKSR